MKSVTASNQPPFRLIEIDEIDSTNAEALRRAAMGERGPLWITARNQTGGRGRSGRRWQSSDGNLTATLLFAPECAPAALHQLSLLTGVAVLDALALYAPQPTASSHRLRLKWPNDILLGTAKLGGILVESTSFGGTVVAAIGIGINIATAPALPDRTLARLYDIAPEAPSARDILTALDARLRLWLGTWQAGRDFAAIRAAWLERAGPIGEPITIHAGKSLVSGAFAGLATDGALLVQHHNGDVERFTTGDVSLGAGDSMG